MSNPMTNPPLDLPAARKIAEEAAYDAPWTYKEGFKTGGARVANTSGFDLPGCFNCGDNDGVYEETTARHIAAFDPPTALALLDRLEAAERDLAAVTVSRDGWQTRAEAAEKKVAAAREALSRGAQYDVNHSAEVIDAQEIVDALDGGA